MMRKAVTVVIPWDPWPNAPATTSETPAATRVTKAQAQAISAALEYLAEKRAAES